MQIYYASLEAIEQQTRQLDHEQCSHCKQTHQLVSHGFIRKKRTGAEPEAIGKRVFCSNRNNHLGCGRTMRLYLDSTVRYLHYTSDCVVAFVLSRIQVMTVQQAYQQATGTGAPRNAYRWLNRLWAQLSVYRSLCHQPQLEETEPMAAANHHPRQALLTTTFNALLRQFGQPLCAGYQGQLQRSFL